jgi:hypothetical protein
MSMLFISNRKFSWWNERLHRALSQSANTLVRLAENGMAQDIVTLAVRSCHLAIFAPESKLASEEYSIVKLFTSLKLPISRCTEQYVNLSVLSRLINEVGPPTDKHNRKVVLLCGAFLEEQVSVSAHHLLMYGYEVYLVRDLIAARDRNNAHIHDHRLAIAGAVSVTERQLIYEWIASESEPQTRSLLKAFVTKQ